MATNICNPSHNNYNYRARMANTGLSIITIIQHNVLKWMFTRRNELTNLYSQHNPDLILLNSTGQKNNERIKIMNYNVYQRNKEGEDSAGVVVAVKRNIQHQIIG